MGKAKRDGFYTQITGGFKDKILSRIAAKKRTIKYFIEGFYLMSDSDFKKVFDLIDKAHEKTEI